MRMGMPYDKSSATTDAEIIALNALIGQLNSYILKREIVHLEEPRKIHPKQMTTTTVKMRAFRGNLRVGWTLAKNLEAGRPPSLCSSALVRIIYLKVILPGKSENHSATGSHDTEDSKNQADER